MSKTTNGPRSGRKRGAEAMPRYARTDCLQGSRVVDGNTAVALVEASFCEVAGLRASFPADGAARAWKAEEARQRINCFGSRLVSLETDGPRGALAAAMGLAMTGTRATTFLSGPDLVSAQDLLVMAAGRHLPLIVHLCNRTLAAQAGALGTGHKAYHMSADTGFFVLLAASAQEAVDFTLVARRVTELGLIPGLVAMDGEQTALALQDVCIPNPIFTAAFLGPPDGVIPAPTPAQRLLFGETRRRVPRWHDLDHPVLHGALQGPESWALGAVGKHPYFDQHLNTLLEESIAELRNRTGRPLDTLSTYRLKGASLVLAAQGSAIETARAVADYAHRRLRLRVGVLGVHCLRPFPGARIAEYLRGKRMVAVLERVDTPLATDPPLTRQLRAAVDRALEEGHQEFHSNNTYPSIGEGEQPRFRSVTYGLGGLPLRAADLVALCEELAAESKPRGKQGLGARLLTRHREPPPPARSHIYLGFDFARASSIYPKRQVLLDRLRRDYPEVTRLGLLSQEGLPDLRPSGAYTVAVHRLSGQGGEGLAAAAATFLHHLVGGQIRSRPGLFWGRWEAYCVDRFTHAPAAISAPLHDPGDQVPIDFSVITTPRRHERLKPVAELRTGGALLLMSNFPPERLWQALPGNWREEIRQKRATCYQTPLLTPEQSDTWPQQLLVEHMLGSTVAVLLAEGALALPAHRVLSAREALLKRDPQGRWRERSDAFAQGFEGTLGLDRTLFSQQPDLSNGFQDDETPLAVRRLAGSPDNYASLPRFWDQVGALYAHGDADELSPDPFLATGVVPPLTSTFRSLRAAREWFPAIDPSRCTGCGRCWMQCPDGAIRPTAISTRALLETGIRMAGAESLRPVLGQLARQLAKRAKNGPPASFDKLLEDTFTAFAEKAHYPPERDATMRSAFQGLREQIGLLPVAITEPFFHAPEAQRPGQGSLLALAIDPHTCKGCGLCINACDPQALFQHEQEPESADRALRLIRLWEQLPDTPGDTIAELLRERSLTPLAALLLSRHCLLALAGGDGAEPGSGEKAGVRLVLAITEFLQQPRVNRLVEEIKEVEQGLETRIRTLLTDALPIHDLDTLSASIEDLPPNSSGLARLAQQLEAVETATLDVSRLRRLIAATKSLSELRWKLTQGAHGGGRARLAIAVAPGSIASWAGAYPYNPFSIPVAIDITGETASLAAGLIEGQLREAAAGLLLLRQARAELHTSPRTPSGPDGLTWKDLTPDERQLCPPLYLLGNNDVLGARGLSAVLWLLGSGMPIKILIFSHLDLGLDTTGNVSAPPGGIVDTLPSTAKTPNVHLGFLALTQRRAFVAQTCIAAPEHFFESIQAALSFPGPALIHAHAPSPEHHGFAAHQTFARASGAVRARAFPLFRYDPRRSGVFGSRLDLAGNLCPEKKWVIDAEGQEPFTLAHWAFAERRFARYFSPLNERDPTPVPLADYLETEITRRSGTTPFITEPSGAGSTRYRVDAALVAATQERLEAWRSLQELAGVVTPFTSEVEQRAEQRLRKVFEAERDQLQQTYERQLRHLKAQTQAELAARVEAKLLALAGYDPRQVDPAPGETP
nr:4Fe-4S binding protein [Gammaproteobacteria bacterium]